MRLLPLALLVACDAAELAGATDDPEDPDRPPVAGNPSDVPPEPEGPTWEECFGSLSPDADIPLPDYAQFGPVLGSHCSGTNHQDIAGIERVVFLGDSVTVGTPPTPSDEFYRSRLAASLATQFGLEAPSGLWEQANWITGTALVQESGAFASCAEWGAKNDDLLTGDEQIAKCFPSASLAENTLVVMTMGGNNLDHLTTGFVEGKAHEQLWAETEEFMADMRGAVEWLEAPGRFPAGVSVVFTNLYEFTDGTGDTTSCPAAALAGFTEPVDDPALAEMVVWSMEQYMSIAVDTQTDMLFLLEAFCGHGYHHDDPSSPCYRGPDAELWFDASCIHPNPTGHAVIADMFLDVVAE